MLKFYHILLLTLVAVFIASAAGIARYAADSCTQARMYRQLAAQTEKIPDDAALNCTPFVRQYDILSNRWGDLLCQEENRTNDIRRNSRKWL